MATWVSLDGGEASKVLIEGLGAAVESINEIQEVFKVINTVLDTVKEPLALVESLIRAIINGDGLVPLLELLGQALLSVVLNFFEGPIWALPIFPQNINTMYAGNIGKIIATKGETVPGITKELDEEGNVKTIVFNPGPTIPEQFKKNTENFLNAYRNAGADYLIGQFENALKDPWDHNKPKLDPDTSWTFAMVLGIGASDPASMGQYAEVMNAILKMQSVSEFFSSISGMYHRLTDEEIRAQGTWPDFYSYRSVIDFIPDMADWLRSLKKFAEILSNYQESMVVMIIESIQLAIDYINYIAGIIEGILNLLRWIASLKLGILTIPPAAQGINGLLDQMWNATNKPEWNYSAGLILLGGGENFDSSISVPYQVLTALFPSGPAFVGDVKQKAEIMAKTVPA